MTTKPDPAVRNCFDGPELTAYLSNELLPERRAEIDRHLATCTDCARLANTLRATKALLQQAPPAPAAPPDLTERIMASLPADAWTPAPRRHPAWAWPAAAAAALALLAGIGFIMQSADQVPSAPRLVQHAPSSAPPTGAAMDEAQAVARALDWLQRTQQADGSWSGADEQFVIGTSSLALLAMLNAEEPDARVRHQPSIRTGINYLLHHQQPSGLIGPEVSGGVYNHGLATLALLEANAADPQPEWAAAADRALAFISAAQTQAGGWGYLRSAGDAPNSAATVWPLLALVRADVLGRPGLKPAIGRGTRWLRSTISDEGTMGYRRADDHPTDAPALNAAGAVCLLLADRQHAPDLRAMLRAVGIHTSPAQSPLNFYQAYFQSRVQALAAGTIATTPAPAPDTRLASLQRTTGNDAGSWDANDPWGNVGGRVYSTAMATLAMQCLPRPLNSAPTGRDGQRYLDL